MTRTTARNVDASGGGLDGRGATGKALEKAANQLQRLTLNAVENGVGPITGSRTYAEDRLRQAAGDVERAVKRIVRESVAAAGANGFVTGVGGLVSMPITIPANVAGGLIINARMVGAIAHLRGFDLNDPHTQAMLTLTVAGSSAQSAAATFGAKVGQELATQAIKKVPTEVLRQVNRKVGFYLVAKYGTQRSVITLAKAVPGVGGVIGGSVDATLTRGIASVAKKVFPAPSPDSRPQVPSGRSAPTRHRHRQSPAPPNTCSVREPDA